MIMLASDEAVVAVVGIPKSKFVSLFRPNIGTGAFLLTLAVPVRGPEEGVL